MKRLTLGLSLALITLTQPVFATPAHLTPFVQNLNQKMESLLQKQMMRQKIGFQTSAQQVQKVTCETCGTYVLNIPDHVKRDTVFDLKLNYKDNKPHLMGQVYSEQEKQLVTQLAQQHLPGAQVDIDTFPFDDVAPDYAISKSFADLYVKPMAVAGDNLATQVRMGTPLEILDYDSSKNFALVRIVDDGYIAYIHRSKLQEVNQAQFQDWKDKRKVLLMREVKAPELMHFGTRLKLLSQTPTTVTAALPTGKVVKLNVGDVRLVSHQMPAAKDILTVAQSYLPKAPQGGGQYLWGGTFGKRVDCSGFVQTVYRVNDVYLPRDADQQQGFTQPVAPTLAQIDQLKPGDLIFFSGHRKWATHVGLYMGDNKVIHSSSKGPYDGVKISTLKGGGTYDRYLQSIYFGAGRVTRSL